MVFITLYFYFQCIYIHSIILGKKWIRNTLITTSLLPLIFLVVYGVNHVVVKFSNALSYIPVGTFVSLILIIFM